MAEHPPVAQVSPDDLTRRLDAAPLLKGRLEAVRAGRVPLQNIRIKRSTQDLIALRRQALRQALRRGGEQ